MEIFSLHILLKIHCKGRELKIFKNKLNTKYQIAVYF